MTIKHSLLYFLILFIVFLEGFAGLGIEIYAIRVSAIYIGASTAITGVILAMVLVAIAIGYWLGGKLSQHDNKELNLLLQAGYMLSLATASHTVVCIVQMPLMSLIQQNIKSNLFSATIAGFLFGFGIAFGSASIPLITQFLTLRYARDSTVGVGKFAGQVLATTTIGSVLGSTLTPIVLLPRLGLMATLGLCIFCLAVGSLACSLIARFLYGCQINKKFLTSLFIIFLSFFLSLLFIFLNKTDTGYQTPVSTWFINEYTDNGYKAVALTDAPNRTKSSCWVYDTKHNCNWYGEKVVDMIEQSSDTDILFLGGAGMSIPSEIAYKYPNSKITVVELDKDIKPIVEKYFLKEPLAKNINFIGDDGRAYSLKYKGKKYDYMLIDAFNGSFVVSNLFSVEAIKKFEKISNHVVANVIGYPSEEHQYTQIILSTWYKIFRENAYIVVKPSQYYGRTNMLLCNYPCMGGKKLSTRPFFNKNAPINTDNFPVLDRYYFGEL